MKDSELNDFTQCNTYCKLLGGAICFPYYKVADSLA